MLRRTHRLPLVVTLVVLAGCGSNGDDGPPSPSPPPSSASTAASEALPPSPGPSSDSVAPPHSPEPSLAAPSQDPSTAGSLDETSLPQEWLGFTPAVVNPSEGEFNPNGTWVHGQDSALIAQEALPACGDEAALPVPTAALTGTYRDHSESPGNGIALEFDSAESARSWFEGYTQTMASCTVQTAGFEVVDMVVDGGSTLRDIRDYQGMRWAERVWVEDEVVRLIIVQGGFTLVETAQRPQ